MRKTALVSAAAAWPFNRANVRERYTNVFRPISVASLRGVLTQAQVQQGICSRCTCRSSAVLRVTLGESSPGSHPARCKGQEPYSRTWTMHIPVLAYLWWHLTPHQFTQRRYHTVCPWSKSSFPICFTQNTSGFQRCEKGLSLQMGLGEMRQVVERSQKLEGRLAWVGM